MLAEPEIEEQTEQQLEDPWVVMLWDDPVNDMAFVTFVIAEVFQYGRERASQIMLEAHTNGRARTWVGERSEAEQKATQLHSWKLQATLERG
jgi:ATP-dependent Clp protease adaptor protein ClpS